MRKTMVIVLTASFFLVGCTSATVIRSNPSGASLYVEGNYECVTPCTHSDAAVSGTSKSVQLKKAGYRDFTGTIKKEETKIGPMIGGILVLFPFIWVRGYPAEYVFDMEKSL